MVLRTPDKIYVGQVLRLTGSPSQDQTVYTVKAGDTLSGIAARFGTTYQVLAQINGISDPDRIYPGQTLRIPSGAQASAQYYTIRSGDNPFRDRRQVWNHSEKTSGTESDFRSQ